MRDDKLDEKLAREAVRGIVELRFELLTLIALAAVYIGLGSTDTAAVLAGVLLVALIAIPQTRWLYQRAHIERSWAKACRDVGALDPPPLRSLRRTPFLGHWPTSIRRVKLGERMRVRVAAGHGVEDLKKHEERLASALKVREVRVHPWRENAGIAYVTLVRRDPFGVTEPIDWPHTDATALSIWDPIPTGDNEDGETRTITLPGHNVLIAGETRSGKSRGLALIAATAALDTECDIWIMDGKEVELTQWFPVARRVAGASPTDTIDMLTELQAVMSRQYQELKRHGRKKTVRGEYRPQVLICDELAYYTMLDQNDTDKIMNLLVDIAARGLAAGVSSVIATQQPAAALHPKFTMLRANLTYRVAYRMNSREGSTMVLGQDNTTAGRSATVIEPAQKGVGWLLTEGLIPEMFKGYLLTDEQEADIISRAIQTRMSSEINAALPQPEPAPRASEIRPAQDREMLLRTIPYSRPGITRSQLESALGTPEIQWRDTMRQLVKDGDVIKQLKEPERPSSKINPYLYRRGTAN